MEQRHRSGGIQQASRPEEFSMLRARLIPSLGLLLFATPVLAQTPRDTTAHITGTVTSIFDGKPLTDVLVAVPAAKAFTVTDSTGRFDLAGLPAGTQTIRVAHRDGRMQEYRAVLKSGKTKRLSIILDVEAVDLAPIVVQASWADTRWGMAGFYARRRYGFGRFYTAADIAQRNAESLRGLIASAGVSYGCVGAACGSVTFARGRRCLLSVYLNGVPAWPGDEDYIDPRDVAGVEVYRNALSVPFDFSAVRGRLAGSGVFGAAFAAPACGSLVIWMKDWRSMYDIDP
jgi:hypothetical protein